jgi:hypothetical protein
MERIEADEWSECNVPLTLEDKSVEAVQTFITDYAAHAIALSKLPFSAIGSLTSRRAGIDVQPYLGPLISSRYFNSIKLPYFLGPFRTNKDRYVSHCDIILDNIGKDGCYDENAEDACLMYLWVKDLIDECGEMKREEQDCYVKHADEKCDQFMTIDDHLKAVIDWEW